MIDSKLRSTKNEVRFSIMGELIVGDPQSNLSYNIFVRRLISERLFLFNIINNLSLSPCFYAYFISVFIFIKFTIDFNNILF